MGKKTIITVGMEIPGDDVISIGFDGRQSLADADIAVLCPNADPASYDYSSDSYCGKVCLSDYASERFMSDVSHWRTELCKFVETGKTAFLILDAPKDGYYATGVFSRLSRRACEAWSRFHRR